jgi:hypothetical protein
MQYIILSNFQVIIKKIFNQMIDYNGPKNYCLSIFRYYLINQSIPMPEFILSNFEVNSKIICNHENPP